MAWLTTGLLVPSASLTIWTAQLTALEAQAGEHEKFGNDLVARIAEPLKILSVRYEEIRKRHTDYAVKLEKERDAGYAELKKTKGNYDGVCEGVESRRKKADSAFDYGKQKAQTAYQQHTENMHNIKVGSRLAVRSGLLY